MYIKCVSSYILLILINYCNNLFIPKISRASLPLKNLIYHLAYTYPSMELINYNINN